MGDRRYANPAEAYEAIAEVEKVFLEHVEDDEIRVWYLAARVGDKSALESLAAMAYGTKGDWTSWFPSPRPQKADRAIEILDQLRKAAH
jgi:hypothetical protein